MSYHPKTAPPPGSNTFFGLSFQVLGAVFLARIITDISTRMLHPFIPQLSAGLGLTVVGFGWLLFIRATVGLSGPIFGMLADRHGRRLIMALSLLCQAVGVLGLALAWRWWAVLPIMASGLSVAAFIPAQQAYISDKAAPHRRGRAMGTIELSWASAAVLILPLVGWMIDVFGWRAPLLLLSLLSLLGSAVVWWRLPPVDEHQPHTNLTWAEIQAVLFTPHVLAAVGVSTLLFTATVAFLSIWGVWLTDDFELNAALLGLIGTGVGVSELGGSISASLFIDRLGKHRGSQLGLLLAMGACLLLPLARYRLPGAVVALIIAAAFIEFTIVSMIALYSEQVPEARGTVLSLTFLGTGLGGAIGPPLATGLWTHYGLEAVFAVISACLLAALVLTRKCLREGS